jgi:hypothetical protein
MMRGAAMRVEGETWVVWVASCWCAEVEVSQEERFVDTHVLAEGEIGHRPSIEDKRSIAVLKSGFVGEWTL